MDFIDYYLKRNTKLCVIVVSLQSSIMAWEVAHLKFIIWLYGVWHSCMWCPISDYKAIHFVMEELPMMPRDAIANKSASIHKVSRVI